MTVGNYSAPPTRRQVLKAGVLTGLGAAVGLPRGLIQGDASEGAELRAGSIIAIYDRRVPVLNGFAIWCRKNGFETFGVTHDIDQTWRALRQKWRTTPLPVIGVTRTSAHVLFAGLASSHGLRPVFRGAHGVTDDRRIEHRIQGIHAEVFGRSLEDGKEWTAAVGRALVTSVGGPSSLATDPRAYTSVAGVPFQGLGDLVSWAFAAPAGGAC